MSTPLLQVRDVRKAYGAVRAVDGVTFHVEPGEIFGLLGPNGAGKSTLLSIIASLRQADAGVVVIDGRTLRPSARDVRRLVGIVPQELALYGELTAAENLCFFGELYGGRGITLEERIKSILAALGLDDRAAARVDTFSGGMQRRLNLGAALVHQPKLLLLDEPTAGVDPQSRNRLFEEIRRLHQAGMTIVYTSHYMEEVQALCSRIGIIDNGRLIACDTLPNLLQRLPARIRFRMEHTDPALHDALGRMSDATLRSAADSTLEMECTNLAATLTRLMATLQQHQTQLTHLETEEPNLERVFLHLTGRALRD